MYYTLPNRVITDTGSRLTLTHAYTLTHVERLENFFLFSRDREVQTERATSSVHYSIDLTVDGDRRRRGPGHNTLASSRLDPSPLRRDGETTGQDSLTSTVYS